MPKPQVLHSNEKESIKDGKRILEKEKLADGPKGLTFTYLIKSGDDFFKISVKETSKNSFEVISKKGDDEKKSTVDLKGLIEIAKKDKRLVFAADYIGKRKEPLMARVGAKRNSKSKSKSKGRKRKSTSKSKPKKRSKRKISRPKKRTSKSKSKGRKTPAASEPKKIKKSKRKPSKSKSNKKRKSKSKSKRKTK